MGVFRIQTATSAVNKGRYEYSKSSLVNMRGHQKTASYTGGIRKQEDRAHRIDEITSSERVSIEYVIKHLRITISAPGEILKSC